MPTWKGIIGKSFSPAQFNDYVHTLQWTTWRPSFVVLHNTGSPNLTQRPDGLTAQHIKNLESFYKDQQKWSAGPHLFIDDKQIWVFTPLTTSGVHSPSWNSVAFGIEMLGDYAVDAFSTGRGLKVRKNTVAAIAALSAALGLNPDNMKLHKEDHLTTHLCPGKNVVKQEVINEAKAQIIKLHDGEHPSGIV